MTEDEPVSLRQYRDLFAERHHADGIVNRMAVARAELVFNLSRLINRLWQDFERTHRRHGATWAGFRILNVLWVAGPSRMKDIARLSGASRASIWSALQTLERDGLVTRTRDSSDRRMVTVAMTNAGHSALAVAIQHQAKREAQWFAILTDDELVKFSALLAKVADREPPPDRDT